MEQDEGPDQDQYEPVARDRVLFDIRFALSKGFVFRPRKRDYTVADFSGWAKAILEHMELTGLKFLRRKPPPLHSYPVREPPDDEDENADAGRQYLPGERG